MNPRDFRCRSVSKAFAAVDRPSGRSKRGEAVTLVVLLVLALAAVSTGPVPATEDSAEPNFASDVGPLFHAKCGSCHRPNGIAPMSLLEYKSTRPWARSIKREVASRGMPPFGARGGDHAFRNDISLSDEEIHVIVSWVDAGAPEGDSTLLPEPPDYEALARAGLPEPDLVLAHDETWEVPPGADQQRAFVIHNEFDHDLWIEGIDWDQRSNVVHHMFLFVDPSGLARKFEQEDPLPGFLGSVDGGAGTDKMMRIFLGGGDGIGGWAPGAQPLFYGEGIGQRIAAGTDFLLQYHYYNQSEETQVHRPRIALYLKDEPPKRKLEIEGPTLAPAKLFLPAGDPYVQSVADWIAPGDLEVLAVMPHMHNLGKDMIVTAHYPDGKVETLLDVPNFDPYWQTVYEYERRVFLPKGTRVHMVAHHDNSADNPLQLHDPPRDVRFGERADDEMVNASVFYALVDETTEWSGSLGDVITTPEQLEESRKRKP